MQLAAIIVSLVLTVVGVALLARAIGRSTGSSSSASPCPRAAGPTTPTQRTCDAGQGVPRPHPDEPVGHRRLRPLVRGGRLPHAAADPRQAFGQLFQADWTAAGHRRLPAVRDVHRVHRR